MIFAPSSDNAQMRTQHVRIAGYNGIIATRDQRLQDMQCWEESMPDKLRVTLEIGPKDKQVVAVAPDWPGLERGAKTGEAAIARLQAYLPRYAPVANLAGGGAELAASATRAAVGPY